MSLAAGLPDGRRGQALALAMTVCAALLVWLGIVGPAQDWFADREERLSHQHAYARRAAALVATLPALRHEAEDLGKDGSETVPLLTGASDAIAAAILQQKLDELAASAGLRLASEEILPSRPAGALRAIPVRVTLSAPWKSFVELLAALASAEIPMSAGDVLVRGMAVNQKSAGLPVDVSLTVTSWRLAKGDAK